LVNIVLRELGCAAAVVDNSAPEIFQRQWATYQKLVEAGIFSHDAVGRLLNRILAAEFTEPFSFLDIACGDAHRMMENLAGTKIASYRGIDLSESALALAAANLKNAPFDVELDHGDFVELIKTSQPTDVAWCGLSVHHLKRDEKVDFLRSVRAATRRSFLIYEPTCLDGETRDRYMDRFVRFYDAALTMLSSEEIARVEHHVLTCDYPETSANWCAIGIEAGFATTNELYCDPTGFYHVYRYDH
jgi:SAM-dependent methyltransferase